MLWISLMDALFLSTLSTIIIFQFAHDNLGICAAALNKTGDPLNDDGQIPSLKNETWNTHSERENFSYYKPYEDDEFLETEHLNNIRLLCWVATYPPNHEQKARHVQETWGRRCDKIIFISTENSTFFDTVTVDVVEDYEHLWAKTRAAFIYVYNNYYADYDWFMKSDDDTYVIVENLRYYLKDYSPLKPYYFGQRSKCFVRQGYMFGMAYILSKEALRLFIEEAVDNSTLCSQSDTGPEDLEVGECLQNVGVPIGDSRDSLGRHRFIMRAPLQAFTFFTQSADDDNQSYYHVEEGMDCCSDHAIAYTYTSPGDVHVMDYMLYQLNPYGID